MSGGRQAVRWRQEAERWSGDLFPTDQQDGCEVESVGAGDIRISFGERAVNGPGSNAKRVVNEVACEVELAVGEFVAKEALSHALRAFSSGIGALNAEEFPLAYTESMDFGIRIRGSGGSGVQLGSEVHREGGGEAREGSSRCS